MGQKRYFSRLRLLNMLGQLDFDGQSVELAMRALVCEQLTGVDGLHIRDVPLPECGPEEIRITVASAGLNHRDLLIIEGQYQIQPELPFVPGCEVSGTVEALGNAVAGFDVGDRVVAHVGNGGFAEQVVCRADYACKLPDELPVEQAGGLTVCHSTALLGLEEIASIRPGCRLLVLGASGGAGLAAIEVGAALGAEVTAVTTSSEKAKAISEATGAATLVTSADGFASRLALKDPYDCVFDTLGGAYSDTCLDHLAAGGCHLIVGFAAGGIPRLSLEKVVARQVQVSGLSWGGWVAANRVGQRALYSQLFDFWRKRQIMQMPVETVTIDQFVSAFAAVRNRTLPAKFCLIP